MKICWDNLENIRISKNGNFRDIKRRKTYYLKTCKYCGEEFLGRKESNFCNIKCTNKKEQHSMWGKEHSDQHKRKIGKSLKKYYETHESKNKERKISEKTRQKMIKSHKGKKSSFWKGGYHSKDIPMYDTYAHQIDWVDKCKRNKVDPNIMEVKCAYCGRWFVPSLKSTHARIQSFKETQRGERRLYCSDSCKKECPIYMQKAYPRGYKKATSREVQPELRQLVLKRDNYTCQKCGNTEHLHCHHIKPVADEPIESADVDNCITYCKECHKEAHQKDGCGYNELRTCA